MTILIQSNNSDFFDREHRLEKMHNGLFLPIIFTNARILFHVEHLHVHNSSNTPGNLESPH